MTACLLCAFWIIGLSVTAQERAAPVAIHFEPESPTEAFIKAVAEYDTLWKAEGVRMVEEMERITGLPFGERAIKAVIYEGTSFSGSGDRPMRLRASYPAEVKKATLVHELLHRMLGRVKVTSEIDEHRKIFLVLYDIWVALYGKEFADRNVAVEAKRKGLYDYESAWKWALAMSAEERAGKFKMLRGLGGAASWLPARRAARINPVSEMQHSDGGPVSPKRRSREGGSPEAVPDAQTEDPVLDAIVRVVVVLVDLPEAVRVAGLDQRAPELDAKSAGQSEIERFDVVADISGFLFSVDLSLGASR